MKVWFSEQFVFQTLYKEENYLIFKVKLICAANTEKLKNSYYNRISRKIKRNFSSNVWNFEAWILENLDLVLWEKNFWKFYDSDLKQFVS